MKLNLRNPNFPLLDIENNLNNYDNDMSLFDDNKLSNNQNIIELEPNFVVTKISWTRKEEYKFNYFLGIFEGSNDPSFCDGVPLAMIKEVGKINEINYINIDYPNVYKYIRYIPPNNNYTDISPIKIIGHKLSETKENLEKKYFQATNLPLISIYTENLIDPIEKNLDFNCKILIINNGIIENNETGLIKLRGKSTASIPPKKPYRIKFSTKQKILGLKGSSKKWILMANAFDRSLLRNDLAYKISELFNFKYTHRCLPVDVILNGIFRGNYYICDLIEIAKNRVNITKMELNDINEPNITGGYLLEFDAGVFFGKKHYKTDKGILYKIHSPKEEEITSEQESYITNRMNKFENEIYNNIFDSFDIDTFSKFFLIKEFCGDIDILWSSFYFYKERNDEKFYFGPAYDFDLSLDNYNMKTCINCMNHFVFERGGTAGTLNEFVRHLIKNKYIIEFIKKTWEKLCDTVLNKKVLIDFLEEREEYLKESSDLNFLKWDNYFEEISNEESENFGRRGENFEESVQVLKDYINLRFDSLSKIIDKAVSSAH